MDCDICHTGPQQMQIGNMETGEQLFVCAPCFARFGLDMAKAILPAEEVAAQLGPMFVTPGRDRALKSKPSKASRKTPAAAQQPEPEPGPAAGDEEAPAGAQDA